MLESIICFLISKLDATEYFQKIFPMAELIMKGDNLRPAEYAGDGQFQDITLFDRYNGMAYFRRNGRARISKVDIERSIVPCSPLIQIERPIRLVICVPKSKFTKDDEFSDDRIAETIIEAMTIEGGPIKADLKADSVVIYPTEVITNNKDVLSEEYQGFELKDINYKFAYLAIDLIATVQIKKSCMITECEPYNYN